MAYMYLRMENARTRQTGDLQVYVPSGTVAAGTLLPVGFKTTPTANSATTWLPPLRETWIIRDVITDGKITAGAIQLMESTQPTETVINAPAHGPTNPGRPVYTVPLIGGVQYSLMVTAPLTVTT